jgi:hypothetical protein
MEVHWQLKWMAIPHHGETVTLQGMTATTESDMLIQLLAVNPPQL